MSAVLDFNQRLVAITCYKCGITFAVPQYFKTKRQEDTETFWCPNGHNQAYVKSEAQKLREQLAEEKRNSEWWQNVAKSRESQIKGANIQLGKVKAKLKRTEIRVSNGVCPCCNRSFTNVRRHMKTKHPDYIEGASE